MPDTDSVSHGESLANSALVDLERSKNEENPWRAKALELIKADADIVKKYAESKGRVYEDVKHYGWFVDYFAEELEVQQTITNGFAFAEGKPEHSFAADGACDACEEPIDGLGCKLAGGAKATATERLDEALEQIENDDFVKFSKPSTSIVDDYGDLDAQLKAIDENPVGAEPGGPDDTHGLSRQELARKLLEDDTLGPCEGAEDNACDERLEQGACDHTTAIIKKNAADEEKRPIILEIVSKPEDILAASDPQTERLGELAREVNLLREQLREKDDETTKLAKQLADANSMIIGLGNELEEWRAQDRKSKRRIADLVRVVKSTAAYIDRNKPRQPSAKSQGFAGVAQELHRIADPVAFEKQRREAAAAAKKKATAKKPAKKR